MELQLELALSSSTGRGSDPNQDCGRRRKRSFETAFLGVMESVDSPQTLPLLIWDDMQRRSNGELHEQKRIHDLAASDRNGCVEDDVLVGWPPVKSWRKQFRHHSRRECASNYVNVENGGGDGGGRRLNSMYVKVKMEGVGIGRKVDLSSHRSYQTLIAKLIAMFGKCEDNVETYKLTYQDKEGDWLLAGDVPWE
ncbi:UNVERIFIED_CONTAM: Auxin-responsive protein IAA10 [Sesamum radiatum]|uniref:Auxin-responsive protein n=1 Tax=Sesamum radiatum TaxID=300843 RepID=A0AAW2NQ15_SESRA